MLFGPPTKIAGLASMGATQVDHQEGMVLMHGKGQLSILHSSIDATTFQEASIMGTQGRIKIHSSWWKAAAMTVMRENLKNNFVECPMVGNGYQYEVAEFMNCLRNGKLESEIMPLDETLSILKTMDTLREQFGLKYPMDAA
jgi:hypothetical protein